MLVYVLNKHGDPLMPCSSAKARRLLKEGKAVVIRRTPFTIKLKFGSSGYKQPVSLGVDSGYKNIGLSAVTDKKELFSAEVKLRSDIVEKLSEKRMYRRNRRNKLWYRKPRFLNRKKESGWLAPSIQHKFNSHVKTVNFVKSFLPVTRVIIEVASFDIQKIKNPEISGAGYQTGDQAGFWNTRAYVLHRDKHKCQHCRKSSLPLNVHHIKSRMTGGDRPANLITLCKICHTNYHKGKVNLSVKKHVGFSAETFMSAVRWKLVDKLKCQHTYGYITKTKRIAAKIEKSHNNDAFIIAGGETQKRDGKYDIKEVRRNNRTLQLNRKGFKPAVRKQKYKLTPNALVRYKDNNHYVKGVHCKGSRVILDTKKSVKLSETELIKYSGGRIIIRSSNSSHV